MEKYKKTQDDDDDYDILDSKRIEYIFGKRKTEQQQQEEEENQHIKEVPEIFIKQEEDSEENLKMQQSNKKLFEIMENRSRTAIDNLPIAIPMEIQPMTMECAITAFVDMNEKLPLRTRTHEFINAIDFF